MSLETYRKERSTQKRAAILMAALGVFRRQGFAQSPMETVAREAGVSTATLYRHFRSKEALFEAVATDAFERSLSTQLVEPGSPEIRLQSLARAYATLLSAPDTRGFVRLLISETGRNEELSNLFYSAIKLRLSDTFSGLVQAGMDAGVFRRHANTGMVGGQLQGMIEHSTLMLGLVRGDEAQPVPAPEHIADESYRTWAARWRS